MAEKQNKGKRLDSNRIKLRKGESQRKNGTYDYRWTSPDGKRHTIYATSVNNFAYANLRQNLRQSTQVYEHL